MHAIVSLLDDHHFSRMVSLWEHLEEECGLSGITLTPLPHFSWHIADQYDFKRLDAILTETAEQAVPFRVRTSGLGIFTGPNPVVFIQLIKDRHLAKFHRALWEKVHPTGIDPSIHYSPDVWVPHVTLAYGDVNRAKLGCAMERLAFQPFSWEIHVDHLALVYQFSGEEGKIQSKFPFARVLQAEP